jgi:hypothetical protein
MWGESPDPVWYLVDVIVTFAVLTMTGSNRLETDTWLHEVGAGWRHPGMFSMFCVDK